MPKPLQIVVLSGAVASGKSTLANTLADRKRGVIIKTRDLILERLPRTKVERASLQRAGEKLDQADGGLWVQEALARLVEKHQRQNDTCRFFVIDSVRIRGQIEGIRQAFPAFTHHIHLEAPNEELAQRFAARADVTDGNTTYDDVLKNKTERNIGDLSELADIVVNTARCSAEEVCIRASALLGTYYKSDERLVDVLVGGQYGSEGKGNIVGHIAHEYGLLVRVGGPNAGHKVFAEPAPEAYFHLPSGTERAPNAKILIGAGATIYPAKFLEELSQHQIGIDRLYIDPQAMVIEDDDRAAETSDLKDISSTAQGVGFATARKITGRGGKSNPPVRLAKDHPSLSPFIKASQQVLEEAFENGQRVMLEGTQGTALSIHHGEYPFVTSRDTTVAGCLADSGIAPGRVRKVILVCRTFPIRVGGPSGPMKHELKYDELSKRSGIALEQLLSTEKTTTTNKQRRLSEFDWEQFRRACFLNSPTDIALTFVDYLSIENRKAFRFEQLTEDTLRFIEEVERVSGRPVSLISTDFSWRNIIDRRQW